MCYASLTYLVQVSLLIYAKLSYAQHAFDASSAQGSQNSYSSVASYSVETLLSTDTLYPTKDVSSTAVGYSAESLYSTESSGSTQTPGSTQVSYSTDDSLYSTVYVYSTAGGSSAEMSSSPVESTAPANPECTWNSIQILDPETWTPVETYEYNTYTTPVVAPGDIDSDIFDMVKGLTLEQKVGQMTQIETGQIADCNGNLNETAVTYWIEKWGVGSFLETPGNHGGKYSWYSPKEFADWTDAVQRIALEKGPKIPIIWGLDSVRGANYVKGGTIFPSGTGTAATFNTQNAYNAGRIAAKDTRSAGVHWAFGPVLDLAVNKLWSRTYEDFGEEPYLSSQMARFSTLGYQGDYKKDRARVATSIKHFIAYGDPFDGSDRADRYIAKHDLLEYYVPPFQAGIDAGAAAVMESYGVINDEAVSISQYYLKDLLRTQLGFKGMMVTDWAEINNQALKYFTAKDVEQANLLALQNTTIDMSMVADDNTFSNITITLVQKGIIPESRIEESAARVLQLKKDLGLFDAPYADRSLANTVGSPQDVETARNAVRESITLLKNKNNVLPLKASDNVLFVGPTINTTRYMGGGWNVHWQGPSDAEGDGVYQGFGDTILKGVEQILGCQPTYYLGVDIQGENYTNFDEILNAARTVDKVVIGLGESSYAEEFGNRGNLTLPAKHLDLVRQVARVTQAPIIVVLVEGRPRILEDVADIADSIIDAYLPGAYGGLPIAEILYGKTNPSGRLPITYPAEESQASDTVWQPAYMEYAPQWPFGYGLGYSSISYSNVTLSSSSVSIGSPVIASVKVTNNGPYPQKEPVLMFTQQQYRPFYAPENYRLRAFDKVDLAVGESKTVIFTLNAEDLAFWDSQLRRRIEPAPVNVVINPYTQVNITAVVNLEGDSSAAIAQGVGA
ncbi:hypothetical protein GGI25_006443 [Coemansia spiralis]|uniref:beta-glucosidase n=1 Tax=Coemansia spiralis TaxID=417178 RepID=A0A9W8G2Q7_9FUNG|nr:glycoside hydrolase superfamily [Coemansia spiralis]KAJ2618596.1 hypothetical protein GGI26_006483 [Coemansia sp. RSA 1358]KAJ2668437.1 hypothetical protein GGI25_006443 [Coemansia spiralis]